MAPDPARSRAEYIGRVNRVLDHIDRHLGEPLGLEALAKVAAFSPFHFHRVFQALMGESLYACVNRLRLERAAGMLVYNPRTPVTTIALECGFSSSANFARAFKLRFRQSATDYRRQRSLKKSKISQANRNPGKAAPAANGQARIVMTEDGRCRDAGAMITVELRTLPPWRIAYVRHHGSYSAQGLYDAWDQLSRWAVGRGLWSPAALFVGIAHDDPEVTAEDRCRYDACLVVDAAVQPEGAVGVTDLPGGLYAVWDTVRAPDQIGSGWDEMYRDWLLGSGYQPDARPGLELYGDGAALPDGRYRVGFGIPVTPL
jgi:AraC family transcriptional regulator